MRARRFGLIRVPELILMLAGTHALTAAPVPEDARAPDDDDAAALALPGAETTAAPVAPGASVLLEGALTEAAPRSGGSANAERLSLDVNDDIRLASQWRAVVGDRLDVDFAGAWNSSQQFNTLKQAYLSWQPLSNLLWDVGRINARQGVAFGYNPTDFFRANALRTVDSLDPNSLRDERLGTVMVRGEALWDGGAVTALYAPRLAANPSNAAFSLDLGATNSEGRWLVSLTQSLTPNFSPQWLVFGTDAGMPQLGLDMTTLLGSSTVAYLEAAAGRSPSLLTQARDSLVSLESLGPPASLGPPPAAAAGAPATGTPESLYSRVSTGFTYSAANKLSVTLEYEYDGAALGRGGWNALRNGSLPFYGAYRNEADALQELPTQQSAFVYLSWQDLIVRHLDATAFVRVDLIDHSRLPWTELRYHWSHIDAALRWQDYIGGPTTEFGAAPTRQTWQLVWDYYL